MAKSSGQLGIIKLDDNGGEAGDGTPAVVGEVRSWTLNGDVVSFQGAAIGDTAASTAIGAASYTVEVQVYFDGSDTPQGDLIERTPVDFELYPEGTEEAGSKIISGSGYMTNYVVTNSGEGFVEATGRITVDGELTRTAVGGS